VSAIDQVLEIGLRARWVFLWALASNIGWMLEEGVEEY